MGTDGEEVHFHGPTSAYAHLAYTTAIKRAPRGISQGPADFRRFLPPVPITAAQHSLALDRFFRFFASWGMRAVPSLFQRDLTRAIHSQTQSPISRTAHYSPMLHNIILAIALVFVDEPLLQNTVTRALFADLADKHLESEMARPTLATVHALALKSSYHSTLGEHTVGWTCFGLADRAAQSSESKPRAGPSD